MVYWLFPPVNDFSGTNGQMSHVRNQILCVFHNILFSFFWLVSGFLLSYQNSRAQIILWISSSILKLLFFLLELAFMRREAVTQQRWEYAIDNGIGEVRLSAVKCKRSFRYLPAMVEEKNG